MNADPESRAKVGQQSIVQIVQHNEPAMVGAFMVVSEVLTWGVSGSVKTDGPPQPQSLPWSHVEPTGGMAVIDAGGKRYAPPAAVARHHP